jgi:hypothetical protein
MTTVGTEDAVADPAVLLAVRETRRVWPTSAETRTYVEADAPEIGEHAAPLVSQRCHWRLYVIGVEPLQVPVEDVSVCPCCAVPLIVGSAVLDGGTAAPWTTAVCREVAAAEPQRFVAVTVTRRV